MLFEKTETVKNARWNLRNLSTRLRDFQDVRRKHSRYSSSETMRTLVRPFFAIAALWLVVTVLTGCKSAPRNPILTAPILIGHGIADIQVRQTSLAQLTSKLGNKFERSEIEGSFGSPCVDGNCPNQFRKFTDINLDYKEFGLLFQFRKVEGEDVPENDLKLRFIRAYCAKPSEGCKFQGKTNHGIQLGSLRKDVLQAHPDNLSWTGRQGVVSSRNGITFAFDSEYMKIQDTDRVSAIDVFAPEDFAEFGHRSI